MINRKLLLALVLAFGIPAQATAILFVPPDASPQLSRYEEGVQALLRNDLAQAEQAFRDSMKLESQSPNPLIGLADVALRRNQATEAKEWLQQAVKLVTDSPQVYHAFGRYYHHLKEYGKAEDFFRKTLSLDSRNLVAQLDLADLYMNDLRHLKQSVSAYRAAVAIDSRHGGAHHGLGMALASLDKDAEAEAEFRKAAELVPDNPLPWLALGRLYLAMGNPDQALAAYDSALKVQAQLTPALIGKGDIFLGRSEFEAAAKEYQRAANLAPGYVDAHVKLGMAYQGLKHWDGAERAYLAALKHDVNLPLVYNNLAWIYVEAGKDSAQALRWALKAVELAPKVAVFQDTLGWVYRARGELDNAASALEKAAVSAPQQTEIIYHLGIVYSGQGKTKEAVAALRKALALNSEFSGAPDARRRIEALSRN